MVTPVLLTRIPTVDGLLDQYGAVLGRDGVAYRNHVYRVVNLCLAMAEDGGDVEKIAVAAVFHDLGIWTDHTFDYIAPSIARAREYLGSTARADWTPEIEAMIGNHHKITTSDAPVGWLVEPFRRADWIDVSRGFRRFGLGRPFISSVFAMWPDVGFHWRLVQLTAERFRRHPLSPLPMVRL